MSTESTIQEALARGYCHVKNESKTLDPDLIDAMTEELMLAFSKELPRTVTLKYECFPKNKTKIVELLDELLK